MSAPRCGVGGGRARTGTLSTMSAPESALPAGDLSGWSLDQPSKRPWLRPVGVGAALIAATTYIGVLDPNSSTNAFPLCPLRYLTGIDCPACGGLRAAFSLTRGDVLQAADHNLLFMVALPFLVVGYGFWLARSLGFSLPRLKPPAVAVPAVLALILGFTIARNLPVDALSFLAST